jgi:2-methylcitrate dehydratase PrpD
VGIAGSMAAGSLEFLADGTWTKRLHPGLAAQNGILAANLAADGFRGPTTILEGRDGFLAGYSRQPRPDAVLENLGNTFEIMRTSIKPHACCRYIQAPIDGLIELAVANDIQPEEVEKVEVAVLEAGWSLVCEPQKRKYDPANAVDAQFSVPFGAAVALTHRKAGLDQFSDENIKSPQIKILMDKVVLQKDSRIEKNFPVEWPSFVKVYLKNGQFFDKYVQFPKGDPENPLTWDELSTKFQSLATRVLPRERCDQIVRSVKDMKSSSILRNIWRLTSRSAAVAAQVN